LASHARPLLLPKVVRLDDVGRVHEAGKVLLQHLQYRLHRRPRGLAHVDDHGEGEVADVVAAKKGEFEFGAVVNFGRNFRKVAKCIAAATTLIF
jgi:hypothetical protein